MHEVDELTGLPTRGVFLRALRAALLQAARDGSTLCLLVIDLDFLKTINDQYGHLAGDEALRSVGGALREGLRERDLSGRYGGDEFVALLAGTSMPLAMHIAERVRATLATRTIAVESEGPHLHLSLSIGVAAFPEDGADAETLFAAADRGVYAAKAAGRDCVRSGIPLVPVSRASELVSAQPGRLVGRQGELVRLRMWLERACRGNGGLAVIEGEAGIGKTRLAEEVAGLAALLGVRTAVACCNQVDLPSAYQPFLDLLRALMATATTEALRLAAGPWAGEVARLLPGLYERLPDALPLPSLPPEDDRPRLQEALCQVLLGLARTPTLLILDDATWADEASVRVLNRLTYGLAGSPLLLLCTVRIEDLPPTAPLATALTALTRQGRCERTALAPLTSADAEALASSAASLRPLPKAVLDRLIYQTAGNPLFLLETLRLLLGGSAPQDTGHLPLAPTVRAVICARLDRLGARERDTLALAAVLGQCFDAEMLAACCTQMSAIHRAEATCRDLELLEREGILRPVGGAYQFGHPLFREVTYATIGVAWRRAMHRRAAAALRVAGAVPETVAEHHRQAGEHAAALVLAREAAEAATEVHAAASAIRLYEMAQASADALPAADLVPGTRADLSRRLGDLRLLDGDSAGALKAYEATRRLLEAAAAAGDAEAASGLVLLHCALAEAHLRRGEDAEALRSAELAELTPRLVSPDGLAARLGLLRARIHESHANYGEAATLAGAILAGDRSSLSADHRAEATWLLGLLGWEQGDWEVADHWCSTGLAEAERDGQPRWAAAFRTGLARVAMDRGSYPEAARLLGEAQALYGKIGDQRGLGLCANHLGNVALYQGEYPKARDWHRRSLAIKDRDGNLRGISAAHHNLGLIEAQAGNLPSALEHLARSLALEEHLASPRGLAETLVMLATVERFAGDLDAARRNLDVASALLAALPDSSLHAAHRLGLAALDLEGGCWRAAHERCTAVRAAYLPVSASPDTAPNLRGAPTLGIRQLGELTLLEGRALLLAGHPEEALQNVVDARAGAVSGELPEVAFVEADALRSLGELETAAAVAGELLTLARGQGLVREEGLALRMLGQIAHDNGAYQNARMLLLRSVAVLDASGMELEATRGRTLLTALPAAAGSAPVGR